MQYNAGLYNQHQYNVDFWSLSLIDTLASSDSDILKYVYVVKLDASTLSESKVFSDTLAALLETLNSSDVRIMLPYLTEIETLTLSDAVAPMAIKALIDSISLSDVMEPQAFIALIDFIFFSELIRIEVVNKAFTDSIRLNDWLSIQKPFVEYWRG